ncbi:tripartite tricarboxylate transporter substrate binding protein [Stutzerimonas tarimensis]|uniref:Tripartite tricarboxylate transporter substrate binding protein n=1 Tax=Stutzerimonas tarimensis TaxID=1507735 RepID=A0ABV7T8Y1_9GAMM
MARLLAEKMTKDLGEPVIIEHRPGAGTIVGSNLVANSKPDGYNLLLTANPLVQATHTQSTPPFDPVEDFTPIARLVGLSLVLAVRSDSGIKTVDDLVGRLRAEPAKHTYGSYGMASSAHLYGLLFAEANKVDFRHIAYRGEAPSVTDLLGGQLTAVFMSGVGALPQIKGGKLTPLAVTSTQRMPALPEVPTFRELGYERMANDGWFTLFGPANMDPAIVDKIGKSAMAAVQQPDVVERLADIAMVPFVLDGPSFAPMLAKENALWKEIIAKEGLGAK